MFVDCHLVFRRTETAHRVQAPDGSARFSVRTVYAPGYAAEDYGTAAALRDALTRETGLQAAIGTVKLWKGAPHGKG